MKNLDTPLLFTFIGLTVFGLIMMSSISVASSLDVADNTTFYFWRHLRYIVLGTGVAIGAFLFPIQMIKRLSVMGYFVALFLLALTLFIGKDLGTTAKSWIIVGGFSVQPVEIAKLMTVILLAVIFSRGRHWVETWVGGFLPFCAIVGIPAMLVVMQPDFGSLFVLGLTTAMMYFVAGADIRHFGLGALLALLGATVASIFSATISQRWLVFVNPDLDPLGAGFQVKQALIAIGSGGWFGRGFHNSIQKFDYLPEVQSDTIFSAISEELGFFRVLILLGVYAFIAWRGLLISRRSTDSFQQFLALGITLLIVLQAFINIAVNLALFPNTGITLPLISYGGSSLLITCAAMGILLHISSNIQEHRKRYLWR